MNTQPEALRLADEFERPYWDDGTQHGQLIKAAAELRSLHEESLKLRGEIRVLVGLLKEALQVIETVDGEDADECNRLMELQNKMGYAILGASV